MKLFNKLKFSARSAAVFAVLVASVAGGVALNNPTAEAATCGDKNAVICGGGSSANAIYNKYHNGDGRNSAGSIKDIYRGFNISSSDMDYFKQNAQSGSVGYNGDVYVGGKLVATNATTAGRDNLTAGCGHSTRQSQGGTVYYTRKPCVSFQQSSLPALIVMKNGVFQFAIINSCGNPVSGTPKSPPKPAFNVKKEVSKSGENNFQANVTVNPGDKVTYKVTVRSTGEAAAKNVRVNDSLPNNVDYVNGTLTQDGKNIGHDKFFGNGVVIDSIAPDKEVTFRFNAIVAANQTGDKCDEKQYVNNAHIDSPELPGQGDHADVNTKCQPTYECSSLTANSNDNKTYNFTATAEAKHGAQITGYQFDFGDGKSAKSNDRKVSHTYTQSGTFTAQVTALIKVNGNIKQVTGQKCKVTVKPSITNQPVYSCDSLSASRVNRTSFNFTGQASASNGATITGYHFDFGDGQSVTNGAGGNTASHTYAQPGTYTIVLTALVDVNGTPQQATSAACKTTVRVTPPPKAECTGLTAKIGDGRNVTVTATYTPGATLTGASYDFGDGSAPVVTNTNTASHTYAQDGSYLIVATLTLNIGGQTTTSKCQVPVNFSTPQPIYTCDAFSLAVGSNRSVTVNNFKTTATNGAVFTHAVINWGDGSDLVTTANVIGQTHTYANDGTYTANVTAHFSVNGVDVAASGTNCQQPVTFTSPPCTPPNDHKPECVPPCTPPNDNKPECTPPEECTTTEEAGKVECAETPTTLVNTGPGEVAGMFAATVAIGATAYRWYLGRRITG